MTNLPSDPSFQDLRDFSSTGSLTPLRTFCCTTLPSLPVSTRKKYCDHVYKDCSDIPCTSLLTRLAISAAEGGQVSTFTFIFDTFLSPRSIAIPWLCLLAAADLGSIELAGAFEKRQNDWCNVFEKKDPIFGYPVWPTQIKKKILRGKFRYIDFMIACGADVNIGGMEQSPIMGLVRSVDGDGKFFL